MAIFHSNFFRKLKGKIDDLIVYEAQGQQRIRKKPEKQPVAPTYLQTLQRNRMRAVVSLYRANEHTEIHKIWKVEARDKMISGYNLFISANLPAFDVEYKISDYSMLVISCGKLQQPQRFRVTDYGKGYICVSWQNIFPHCSPQASDVLQAVWLKDNGSFSLQVAKLPLILREEEQAVLNIPEAGKENMHLYLYFANQERTSYSTSKYFFLESKK